MVLHFVEPVTVCRLLLTYIVVVLRPTSLSQESPLRKGMSLHSVFLGIRPVVRTVKMVNDTLEPVFRRVQTRSHKGGQYTVHSSLLGTRVLLGGGREKERGVPEGVQIFSSETGVTVPCFRGGVPNPGPPDSSLVPFEVRCNRDLQEVVTKRVWSHRDRSPVVSSFR